MLFITQRLADINPIYNIKINDFSLTDFTPSQYSYSHYLSPNCDSIKLEVESVFKNTDIRVFIDEIEVENISSPIPIQNLSSILSIHYLTLTYQITLNKESWKSEPFSFNTSITSSNDDQAVRINCPRIIGSRPGNQFFFYVSATGARPITYAAYDLPETLVMNGDGRITGTTPTEGEYKVRIMAYNNYGLDFATITIRSGSKIQLTPPTGWNSWYAQSEAISDEGIRRTAGAIISHNLHNYGIQFINIDDCWQGSRSTNPPYRPTGKKPFKTDNITYGGFPDMRKLTKDIHQMGLKIGIYSGPKPSTYAGFIGSSSFSEQGIDADRYSPFNGNPNPNGPIFNSEGEGSGSDGKPGVFQPTQFFGRAWPGIDESLGFEKVGPFWFGQIDTQTFADWGFDYIKWDWALAREPDVTVDITKRLNEAILSTKRDIVLSLSNTLTSNTTLMSQVKELGAQVVRTHADIHDNFEEVAGASLSVGCYLELGGEGFWPDPDMLQVGYIGVPNGLNVEFHYTQLDVNSVYFQMTFWAVLPAPLLFSGDMEQIDEFSLSLLKNREMMSINQDKLGLYAKRVAGKKEFMAKRLFDGSVALGVNNYEEKPQVLTVKLSDISEVTGIDFSHGALVRNVWERREIGCYETEIYISIDSRQGTLFHLFPLQ